MHSIQRSVFSPSVPGVYEAWQMYLWDIFVAFPLGYVLWVSRKLSLGSSNDHFCDVGYGWPLNTANTQALDIGASTSQDSLVNLLSKISLKMAPVWFPQGHIWSCELLPHPCLCKSAVHFPCCHFSECFSFQLSQHWSNWFLH